MFKRIVVGTDGSETAGEAVRQATELAKLSNAKLDIVSAYEPIPRTRLQEEQRQVPGDVQYEIGPREDVNLTLDAAAGTARNSGLEAETHAREGDPADAILDVAEDLARRRRQAHRPDHDRSDQTDDQDDERRSP